MYFPKNAFPPTTSLVARGYSALRCPCLRFVSINATPSIRTVTYARDEAYLPLFVGDGSSLKFESCFWQSKKAIESGTSIVEPMMLVNDFCWICISGLILVCSNELVTSLSLRSNRHFQVCE